MFRELMRKKQQLTQEECLAVLRQETRGVLSVQGEDGYPYGVPINFWYDEQTGNLFFHGGLKGHRVDAVRACDKVSFCVYDAGYRREGEWAYNVRSVVIFGRMRLVEDTARAMELCRRLSYKFTGDSAYIEHEIQHDGPHTLCMELVPEHMTGKLVNEA